MTRTLFAAAALVLLGSGVAGAQTAPTDTPRGTTSEEISNTARLNAEQAAKAKADNITYEQEVSAAAQQVAHDQTEFKDETALYEAEKARVAAEAADQRIKWEADVAACKNGDASRCAQPTTTPKP